MKKRKQIVQVQALSRGFLTRKRLGLFTPPSIVREREREKEKEKEKSSSLHLLQRREVQVAWPSGSPNTTVTTSIPLLPKGAQPLKPLLIEDTSRPGTPISSNLSVLPKIPSELAVSKEALDEFVSRRKNKILLAESGPGPQNNGSLRGFNNNSQGGGKFSNENIGKTKTTSSVTALDPTGAKPARRKRDIAVMRGNLKRLDAQKRIREVQRAKEEKVEQVRQEREKREIFAKARREEEARVAKEAIEARRAQENVVNPKLLQKKIAIMKANLARLDAEKRRADLAKRAQEEEAARIALRERKMNNILSKVPEDAKISSTSLSMPWSKEVVRAIALVESNAVYNMI